MITKFDFTKHPYYFEDYAIRYGEIIKNRTIENHDAIRFGCNLLTFAPLLLHHHHDKIVGECVTCDFDKIGMLIGVQITDDQLKKDIDALGMENFKRLWRLGFGGEIHAYHKKGDLTVYDEIEVMEISLNARWEDEMELDKEMLCHSIKNNVIYPSGDSNFRNSEETIYRLETREGELVEVRHGSNFRYPTTLSIGERDFIKKPGEFVWVEVKWFSGTISGVKVMKNDLSGLVDDDHTQYLGYIENINVDDMEWKSIGEGK